MHQINHFPNYFLYKGWDDCQDFTEEYIKKGNVNAISKVIIAFI